MGSIFWGGHSGARTWSWWFPAVRHYFVGSVIYGAISHTFDYCWSPCCLFLVIRWWPIFFLLWGPPNPTIWLCLYRANLPWVSLMARRKLSGWLCDQPRKGHDLLVSYIFCVVSPDLAVENLTVVRITWFVPCYYGPEDKVKIVTGGFFLLLSMKVPEVIKIMFRPPMACASPVICWEVLSFPGFQL